MEYESIAKAVITSAVKTHLREELRTQCSRIAKLQCAAWWNKNRKAVSASIGVAVNKQLKAALPAVIKQTTQAVSIQAPVRRRRHY